MKAPAGLPAGRSAATADRTGRKILGGRAGRRPARGHQLNGRCL